LSVDQLNRLELVLMPYGLKLLDREWQGWNAQYRFRCARGHEMMRSDSHLLYHLVVCPACRDEEALKQLDVLARSNGGRCMSGLYAGRTARYRFVCQYGHVFEKTAGNLLKGSCCVSCAR
jgi:hypothetical protein